ncbi:MAG TPA: hypothetical protein VEK57_14815 [Thermoanaerobaculia bacterium]|nr:hypothetical protein [Thermoanaerobaculia bacterium]
MAKTSAAKKRQAEYVRRGFAIQKIGQSVIYTRPVSEEVLQTIKKITENRTTIDDLAMKVAE